MQLFNHRLLHKTGATLTDYSRQLSEIGGETITITVIAADYLYIGGDVPFSHRYFKFGTTKNAAASVIQEIAIWDGNSWVAAVDVQDGTLSAGKTFAKSGVVSWRTDRNSSWAQELTTEDMESSGIETAKIYDLYWARVKFTADLTAAINIAYCGHCFSNDTYMRMHYPDLMVSSVLDAFETGKTDWNDQHCLAAQEVTRFLQRKRQMWSPNQLQNWQQFTIAATHKAAEIAYSGFPGDDQEDMRKRAEAKFYQAMNQNVVAIDKNENGHVEQQERRPVAGLFRR
jgi:hypothetical protein